MVELLKFEREGFDFPFYKDGMSKDRWLALIIGILVPTLLIFGNFHINGVLFDLLIFLVPTLAFVYASKGDFSLILKKPIKSDIRLIISVIILEYVFTIIIGLVYKAIFGEGALVGHTTLYSFNLIQMIVLFFQLFGEELIKFFVFIILFAVLMKYSGNRKVSIVVATVLMLVYFGLMHIPAYSGKVLQVLLIQGFGSIFTVFAYLKTKNILVSYICHASIDFISLAIILLAHTFHLMPGV